MNALSGSKVQEQRMSLCANAYDICAMPAARPFDARHPGSIVMTASLIERIFPSHRGRHETVILILISFTGIPNDDPPLFWADHRVRKPRSSYCFAARIHLRVRGDKTDA